MPLCSLDMFYAGIDMIVLVVPFDVVPGACVDAGRMQACRMPA
jgi:hypothetical protein